MSYIPTIDNARLGANAVTTDKVQDGSLVNADFNAAAGILFSKLESTPWHAGNDGAGSGLDADLLDAQSGAYYLARANHTGTQAAATISDFDTQVRTSRLDQMSAPTASVSANSQKIVSLADPTAAQDAATKAYVDATKAGLDLKDSVRLATAAALPANTRTGNVLTASANGALTVDSVAVALNDRILVKDEATGANNGLYYITATGDAGNPYTLTRTTDADASSEVTAGLYTFASEGTANADSGWVLTTNDPITLNTTSLSFTQFSGAGQVTAGTGLTKTGNTVNVGAGTGILANADDVAIDTAVVPRLAVANTFTAANTFNALQSMQGGQRWKVTSVAADYTALATDTLILVDSAGAARTITLPADHTAGDMYVVKRKGSNTVTIDPADADTIYGPSSAATHALAVDGESATVVSDGANWNVV